MIRVFDFLCPSGHLQERFTSVETETIDCQVCGTTAFRQLSTPRVKLEGVTGDFPGAAMKWKRNTESNWLKEQKQNAS
jgi:hypothetical protein